MNRIATSAFGAAILAVIMAASAQAQMPTAATPSQVTPGASQSLKAPYFSLSPYQGPGSSRPLFTIGNLPVVVWAPVQAPYNSHMNRSGADDPIWEPGDY